MRTLEEQFSLHNKTALITGGAGHLGSEISDALAELGAHVLIAGRNGEKCRQKCAEIEKAFAHKAQATPVVLDVTDPASVSGKLQMIHQHYGGLDILVNNAWTGQKNSLETITDEEWEFDVDISLHSVFRCVKHALPGLKQKKGVILNITSMYGHVAPDYRLYDGTNHTNPPSYGAAKAGVIQFTKYLASFLAPYGIRANCLSPGPFPHEDMQHNHAFMQKLADKNPLHRIGQPHEIKGAVALLCSGASSYMTGQHIGVDGGWSVW